MKKNPSVCELAKVVKGLKIRLMEQKKRIEDLEAWVADTEDIAEEVSDAKIKQPAFNIEIDAGGNGMFIGMN